MADFNLTPKPYGYIYVITNTVNGKVYVGQTTLTIAERWYGHQHQARKEKRNTAICHAICKYGVDAFKVSEIGVAHSQDELNLLEMYWVAQYNSMDRQTGYNMRGGGDGGGRHSEEVRQKISAAGMGKPAPNKGKPMPERQRIQLAERMRTDNPRTGTVHSEYSKRKISESNKGKHHIKHDPKDVKRRAELLRTKYMGMSPEERRAKWSTRIGVSRPDHVLKAMHDRWNTPEHIERRQRIIDMRSNGVSCKEISITLGCSLSGVKTVWKRYRRSSA